MPRKKAELGKNKTAGEGGVGIKKTKIRAIKTPKKEKKREIDELKNEKEKVLAMWTGVIFFMILIVSIWCFNIKDVFRENNTGETEGNLNWNEIKNEFSETMSQIKSEASGIIKLQEEVKKSGLEQEQSAIIDKQVEELKEYLIENAEMENKQATSSVNNSN